MSIQYIVEVRMPGARVEHRFVSYEDAKRYAFDVLALNPGIEIHIYQDQGGWQMEIRRDVWNGEAGE